MVWRKKRTTQPKKKQPMRKRRQFGGKKIRQPIQYFTRTTYRQAFFSAAAGTPIQLGINFRLDNVANVTEFTNLYDQYMIKAVKIQFVPRITEASPSATNTLGNLWSVLDYDDSSAPANIDTVIQYQNVSHTQMNRTHTRYLRPCVAAEFFSTGVLTTYGAKRNQWLDCANAAVEHYGIKIYGDALPVGATPIVYDVITKFYLAFKNVR